MDKVLITGGAGFIGSFVGAALQKRGYEVYVFDDFNDFLYTSDLKRERVEKLFEKEPTVIKGSVLDMREIDAALRKYKPELVLHFAALANPGRSLHAAEAYTKVNVLGTNNVLHAAQHNAAQRVIFSGSSSIYDDAKTPFKEDDWNFKPKSPYGASKAAAEMYCKMWHELYDLPITVLRFFSVYGPYGRPDMAPMILADKLIRGEKMEISEGRQRDFTFIDDVVVGVLAAIDKQFDYEVINLGRGEPMAVLDFVKALEKVTGQTADYEMREAPAGEMRVTYADISKARRLLGYEPKVSIEEGARRLVEWMRG